MPDWEHTLAESKFLWDQIAHERVKERLPRVFYHLSLGRKYLDGHPDAYDVHRELASRLRSSADKTPSRELEAAVFNLEDTYIERAFKIYEDETPQKQITNVQLLWAVYSLGLVPFIHHQILKDTCFRLDQAQPSLGLNFSRPDGDRFFVYNSQKLRNGFPVVFRIVDGLKARWRERINELANHMNACSGVSEVPTVESGCEQRPKENLTQPIDFGFQAQPIQPVQLQSPSPFLIGTGTKANLPEPQPHDARELRDSALVQSKEQNGIPLEEAEACWEEIEIVFLSDERVQIHVGKQRETRNYAEFGFMDNKTRNPNGAWIGLRRFAEFGGVVRNGTEAGLPWKKFEKRVQEIRKLFRRHFGISSDPIQFVQDLGYRTRFKVKCGPSFRT